MLFRSEEMQEAESKVEWVLILRLEDRSLPDLVVKNKELKIWAYQSVFLDGKPSIFKGVQKKEFGLILNQISPKT